MEILIFIYKCFRFLKNKILSVSHFIWTYFLFKVNRVSFSGFSTQGIPFINVDKDANFKVGENLAMNNNKRSNPIGREAGCSFFVSGGGSLIIGNNVGMSSTAIVCQNSIVIEDFVKIGGNTCIYDTDFHSLDPVHRRDRKSDIKNLKTKPVLIRSNAFIGAHSTILKGVTIGENSIIGACSVISKDVPANEVWAGNPAKFIRSLNPGK